MQSAKELYKYIISKINVDYDNDEKSSIAFMLMEHWGISKQDYVLDKKVSDFQFQISDFIKRINKEEPIQHILGYEWFYGRKFLVDENALIPRPETEELCSEILSQLQPQKKYKILDVGTGSGCIPITLKLENSFLKVTSIDVSSEALKIAKSNASKLGAEVNFIQKNILTDEVDFSSFDIVVSNPPYVLNSEKEFMKNNVLQHEPHLALFVKDNDPLIFYKKITQKCSKGNVFKVFFEINEQYGHQTKELLERFEYQKIIIKKDFRNKDRIVFGELIKK